ncbi:Putative redox-active protein (C_GCAxxG_C_C) [Tindallia californiensis]|uniref:Putative redox-active protein (C_GCAxxG_C_C) n=1 Tax=Tindallia californiensis TaxID=159292 RepID=A0A1H3LP19_9FIRM|nr:Putative redox-active protein (C_GCAxxG_C_C) [Tindallia californiensis]
MEASLCGTLAVASGFIGLFTEDRQNELVKELFNWYKQAELPVYNPEFPDHEVTVAESTSCYESVSKFIQKEGVAFNSPERSSRCAGVSAEVVRQTAMILNREFA